MSVAWRTVRLRDVLTPRREPVRVEVGTSYANFGIYSFGRGLFAKPPIDGATTRATVLLRARAGQFVYSRLFAFEGAYGLVPDAFDGYCVSNEFPLFDCDATSADPRFLAAYICRPSEWRRIAESAIGVGHRRQRVQPESLLEHEITLPTLSEQQRIVSKIEEVAARAREITRLRDGVEADARALLSSAFARLVDGARREPIRSIAPLCRRPVHIALDGEYPELGVRSFGRGVFHKPALRGAALTWEKLFRVHDGDVVISNIKAWEGAIAVAKASDHRRVASHRYLTLVPLAGVVTAGFLCYYLLTPDGLEAVGKASPGSADRNRTLGQTALQDIFVPMCPYPEQERFDELQERVRTLLETQREADLSTGAIAPSLFNHEVG